MFIQLTKLDSKTPVVLNVNQIVAFAPYKGDGDDGTAFTMANGQHFFAVETFADVSRMMINRGHLK